MVVVEATCSPTLSWARLSHIQTHIHTRTRSRPHTPTHILTLTLPLTFTLTHSDVQKNKMHIWGSPRRVISLSFFLLFSEAWVGKGA